MRNKRIHRCTRSTEPTFAPKPTRNGLGTASDLVGCHLVGRPRSQAKWPVWRSNNTKFHCSECHPCMPMCSAPECRQDTWDGLWRGRRFLAAGNGFLCTGCWLAACSSEEEAALWRTWFRARARRYPEHFSDPACFDEGLFQYDRNPMVPTHAATIQHAD